MTSTRTLTRPAPLSIVRACLAIGFLLAGSRTAEAQLDHPGRAQGLETGSSFHGGAIDSISLATGALTLTVPLGQRYPIGGGLGYQLVLFYSSNPWKYTSSGGGTMAEPFTGESPYTGELWQGQSCFETGGPESLPGLDTHNAGAGWRLSIGGFLAPRVTPLDPEVTWNQDPTRDVLIEADGTRRYFYPTLHPNETFHCHQGSQPPSSCEDGVFYTRDGSYLRARIQRTYDSGTGQFLDALESAQIDAPDGTVRHYDDFGRFTKLENRFENGAGQRVNFLNVTYNDGQSPGQWTLTDSHGRIQEVQFRHEPCDPFQHEVDKVTLTAFGTKSLEYRFVYETKNVPNPVSSVTEALPVLQRIDVVEVPGSSFAGYSMTYYDSQSPILAGSGSGTYSGALESIVVPTGGKLKYDYAIWDVAGCGIEDLRLVEGVYRKHVYDWDSHTTVQGTWLYESNLQKCPFGSCSQLSPATRERYTLVTSPEGDQSLYYFSAQTGTGGGACTLTEWQNGLPFSEQQPNQGTQSGLFISEAHYEGSVVSTNLATNRKRRMFVRYNADPADTALPQTTLERNQRLVRQTMVYDDDSLGPTSAVELSGFDGVGHHRTVELEGTGAFGANPRTLVTSYDAAGGAYDFDVYIAGTPTGGFSAPAPIDPWALHTFTSTRVTEGSTTERTDTCFDPATGFLERTRVFANRASSPVASNIDLVTVLFSDEPGNLAEIRSYGGDAGGAGTADVCTTSYAADLAQYRTAHVWQHGSLQKTFYDDADGAKFGGFDVLRREIDARTGLPASEEDLADDAGALVTTFTYDALSRLTRAQRPEGARTDLAYQNANPATPTSAKVTGTHKPNAGGTPTLAESRIDLDGFGRVEREQVSVPGESGGTQLSSRQSQYDAQGWMRQSSEWTTGPLYWTLYQDFDAFGRPRKIVPPDGTGHAVELAYQGVREVKTTTRIASDTGTGDACTGGVPSDEKCTARTEVYDRYGRLISVTERSGTAGATVTTANAYDLADRLISVTMPGQAARKFGYDGRGLLLHERHPEKGAGSGLAGNGCSVYRYDARGNVNRRFEALALTEGDPQVCETSPQGFDLTFSYDRAERLRTVTDSVAELMKSIEYYTSGAREAGKLASATRHNRLVNGASTTDVVVQEQYFYEPPQPGGGEGLDGRVSKRRTTASRPGSLLRFEQKWSYTPLGQTDLLTYPCEASATWNCLGTPRVVDYDYTFGFATEVEGFLSELRYHPNQMLRDVRFDNGAITVRGLDSFHQQRPSYVAYDAAGNPPASGVAMQYDGSGNVKAFGGELFRYDRAGRLALHQLTSGTPLHSQSYSYDLFGNLLGISRNYSSVPPMPSIEGATNRFTNAALREVVW